MGAVSVLGYYDWALPENRTNIGVVSPVFVVVDSSVGGSAVGTTANLTDRSIATSYGRDGMTRTSGHVFQIDIQTNGGLAAETPVIYGAVVVSGCAVRKNGTNVWVPGKVTCTIDSNAGSYGGGAVFNRLAYFGAKGNDGRSTYPSPTVGFVPFWSTTQFQGQGGDGEGLTEVNKIRIKVEPEAGTGGSDGVNIYDARIGRISVMRCFFASVDPRSLRYESEDPSTIVRAADGTPYVNARRTVRKVSGKMININYPAHFGGSLANQVRPANLVAVNVHAGTKNEVFFAPSAEPRDVSGGTYPVSWTNQTIFGLMSDTLRAKLENKTSGGTDDFWTCDFSITENTP